MGTTQMTVAQALVRFLDNNTSETVEAVRACVSVQPDSGSATAKTNHDLGLGK